MTLTSPPSSAVGHERVELYLYSPYGPYGLYRASVPVHGCTLLIYIYIYVYIYIYIVAKKMYNINFDVFLYGSLYNVKTKCDFLH